MFSNNQVKIIAASTGTYDGPHLVCGHRRTATILGGFECEHLEPGECCPECGAALGADPAMPDLLTVTLDLLDRAADVENFHKEQLGQIEQAHEQRLTVAAWLDRVEADIAYVESPEYGQAMWELAGERYAEEFDASGPLD